MEQYKVIIDGQPVGFMDLDNTPRKYGDILEFMGKKFFTYYTKGKKKKSIFGRYEMV